MENEYKITSNNVIRFWAQELLYRSPLKDRTHYINNRMNLAFEKYNESVRTCVSEGDSILYDAANALVQETSEIYLEQGIKEGLLLMNDALSSMPNEYNTGDISHYISMYNVLFHSVNHAISMMEENRDCCMDDIIKRLRQAQEEALKISKN